MTSPHAFLTAIWRDIINASMTGEWIDASIAAAREDATAPFAEIGPILERLLALGATPEELSRLVRWSSFETSLLVLDMLRDPDLEPGSHGFLSEHLLSADPSGLEGRPGSWPLP